MYNNREFVEEVSMDDNTWKAMLIDASTQSGKTRKCFELLTSKLAKQIGNSLVLFVTQANSTVSAEQIIQRGSSDEKPFKSYKIT